MIRSEIQDIINRITGIGEQGAQNLVKIIYKSTSSSVTITQDDTELGSLSGSRVITSWVNTDLDLNGTISSNPINNLGILRAAGSATTQFRVAGKIASSKGVDVIQKGLDYIDLPKAGTQYGGYEFTKEIWQNSSKPNFNLNMIFVNTEPKDNILNDCAFLMSCIYPASLSTNTMSPPVFFTEDNTLDVKIGTWFYATNVIITGVNAKLSKETIKDGKPLYAVISVAFKSFRQLTAKEYMNWFLKLNTTKSITILAKPGS